MWVGTIKVCCSIVIPKAEVRTISKIGKHSALTIGVPVQDADLETMHNFLVHHTGHSVIWNTYNFANVLLFY